MKNTPKINKSLLGAGYNKTKKVGYYDDLATYLANMSALAKGQEALDHYRKAEVYQTKARGIGFVDLFKTPAGEKLWKNL